MYKNDITEGPKNVVEVSPESLGQRLQPQNVDEIFAGGKRESPNPKKTKKAEKNSSIYIPYGNPTAYASVRFAQSPEVVTALDFLDNPSVNDSILFGMIWSHQSVLRLLWASSDPRIPIP